MPTFDVVIKRPIRDSFRVSKIRGMFDFQNAEIEHRWRIEADLEKQDWSVGLIVGSSGSGKTVVARKLFGEFVHTGFDWKSDCALVDEFPKRADLNEIVRALTSVGLSSPPSWLKPYMALNNGEKFRSELARCLVEYKNRLFVFDEYSSVVDRTVAKTCSAALIKYLKRNKQKMVAVSCHFDIVQWLEPDWVLNMNDLSFTRRRLRRPRIEIELFRTDKDAWSMFKTHHYLSGEVHSSSQCFLAKMDRYPVGFVAIMKQVGHSGHKRVHRLVVLPDFQGLGIGRSMLDFLGDYYYKNKMILNISSSHPSIIRGLEKSNKWKLTNYYKHGTSPNLSITRMNKKSKLRSMLCTFRYEPVDF